MTGTEDFPNSVPEVPRDRTICPELEGTGHQAAPGGRPRTRGRRAQPGGGRAARGKGAGVGRAGLGGGQSDAGRLPGRLSRPTWARQVWASVVGQRVSTWWGRGQQDVRRGCRNASAPLALPRLLCICGSGTPRASTNKRVLLRWLAAPLLLSWRACKSTCAGRMTVRCWALWHARRAKTHFHGGGGGGQYKRRGWCNLAACRRARAPGHARAARAHRVVAAAGRHHDARREAELRRHLWPHSPDNLAVGRHSGEAGV